jgi:hypothetical protein
MVVEDEAARSCRQRAVRDGGVSFCSIAAPVAFLAEIREFVARPGYLWAGMKGQHTKVPGVFIAEIVNTDPSRRDLPRLSPPAEHR